MNIQLEKESIRLSISKYYNGISMTKGKDSEFYSVYYARINCMLCLDDQYIIAIIPQDNNHIGSVIPLSDLPWESFQTRIITKPPIKINPQVPTTILSDLINDKITIIDKLKDRFVYSSNEFPIRIELLGNEENLIFNEKGTVKTALETYSCVISFTF